MVNQLPCNKITKVIGSFDFLPRIKWWVSGGLETYINKLLK